MSQNQNLHSLTKLTEFARDFENQPETFLGRFVNKIQNAYNHSYNTVNEISSTNQTSSIVSNNDDNSRSAFYVNQIKDEISTINDHNMYPRDSEDNEAVVAPSKINRGEYTSAINEYQIQEGRTMVNVLLRIRNLVMAKNTVSIHFSSIYNL